MNNKIRLWLDDIRPMPSDFDIHAKSANEAIKVLKTGNVVHISFDHDLGDIVDTEGDIVLWNEHKKTGYYVASWIEEQAALGNIPPLTWAVHSANPIGSENIRQAMLQADKFWKELY